jgi:hypothetical protein
MLHQLRTSKYCTCLLVIFVCLSALISYQYLHSTILLNVDTSQRPTTIYPYIAVIVDDRATLKLVTAVLNVLQHIPTDWKVQIFTHNEHWPFYKQSALAPFINTNRVFMTPIDFVRNNRSGDDFINLFLTSPSFWRRVQGEKVLYFQIDSAICSNSSYKLTDFLHYDYIGAPWKAGGCCNGGFSIRSRTKTLLLLESKHGRYPLRRKNEDGWFANNLPRFHGMVAPIPIAKIFSVETLYHPRPFAVHKPRIRWLGKENMKRLCNECPETRTVSDDCT